MSEFAIFEMSVGGGVLALSPTPGRTRHYAADWRRLRGWGPDMVVSLVQEAELVRKGAASLGADLQAAGIVWRHFPIPDFDVPEGGGWASLETEIGRVLGQGGKVLIHCFGGCGRSGMAVLRIMIAQGEMADTALARLRALRPCAVETDAQMRWAIGTG